MFVLFFVIVFIAELIVASKIIQIIKKADAKVCTVNEQILSARPQIKKGITSVRIEINKIHLSITQIQIKLKKKKEEYKIVLLKNILTGICFLLLNYNAKRALTTVELALSLKDFISSLRKVFNSLKA